MHKTAKFGALAGLVGGTAMMMSGSAFAGPVYFDLDTTWQDVSGESQHIDTNGNHLLDVGDTLRGIVRLPTISLFPSGLNPSPGNGTNPDLLGIFEAQVTGKVATGGTTPSFCLNASCSSTGTAPTYNFTFGANAGFAATYGAGAMVAFYLGPNTSTFGIGTCATAVAGTCEQQITGGGNTPYLTIGQTGADADEAWIALGAPDDPRLAAKFTTTTDLGSFYAALSVLTLSNNTGYNLGLVGVPTALAGGSGDDLIQAAVSGTIHGIGSGTTRSANGDLSNKTTNYQARDTTLLQFCGSTDPNFVPDTCSVANVPEPSALLLLGTGLLSWAGFARFGRRARRT